MSFKVTKRIQGTLSELGSDSIPRELREGIFRNILSRQVPSQIPRLSNGLTQKG